MIVLKVTCVVVMVVNVVVWAMVIDRLTPPLRPSNWGGMQPAAPTCLRTPDGRDARCGYVPWGKGKKAKLVWLLPA